MMFGLEFSKFVILSVLIVTCMTTLLGFALAFYCVYLGFTSSLPWVATTMTAAWAALGTVCSFHSTLTKSDHSEGGITFEAAKAVGFTQESVNSPGI